jgi:peptidoglycan-N-acetylglucosamine deacetylase
MIVIPKGFLLPIVFLCSVTGIIACNNSNTQEKPDKPVETVETHEKVETPAPDTVFHADTSKLYIYLTFDDGPQHGTTNCINICKAENVKASFFMVGQHTHDKSDGKQIVASIRNSYPQNLLANHSYNHANGKYQNFYHHPQLALMDFLRTQDSLHPLYKIIRLPGNSAWVRNGDIKASKLVQPVSHLLDSAGYNVIGWDLEWGFSHKTAKPLHSPEKLAAQVDSAFARNETHVFKQLVLLSHDRMFFRPEDSASLVRFIQILKQNPKYQFETVDHYPGLK